MSRKIKFHTFHFLFRLFAYLADKSGGWRVFVSPKLVLGSLIVGLGLNSNVQIEAQTQSKNKITNSRNYNKTNVVTRNKTIVPIEDGHIYDEVKQMPKFPGGESALFEFISKNKTTQPMAQCYNGIQGLVVCRFVIEKDGSVSNIIVKRSLDPACDKEAVRILKLLPKFTPGKQNAKAVRVYYTIPVVFKLDD